MKNIIIILLLFSSIDVFSQEVTIGSVKRGYILIAQLTEKIGDTSNFYKLRYLDASSDKLKSIEFDYSKNQLDELYIFFTNMFLENNGSSKDVKVGNYSLNATIQKMVGLKNILITIDQNSNFGLSAKELNKLFGK